MVRKHQVYVLLAMGWTVLAFGAAILVSSGQAEPFVSPSQVPGDPIYAFVGAFGVAAVGWVAVGVKQRREWSAMGRAASLESDGLSTGYPTMVGSVEGRPVRVRTVKRTTGGGGESGSSKSTFTVVEADLAGPAEEGLIVGRGSGGTKGANYPNVDVVTVDEEFRAVGGTEALAREVLTGRVADAYRELGDVEGVLVGDVAGVVTDAVSNATDSSTMGFLAAKTSEMFAGDASTVSYETKGLLLDPAELERRLEAVVATADAFEDATADGG